MSKENQISHVQITVPVVRNSKGEVCCFVYDEDRTCVGYDHEWGTCFFGCPTGDVEAQGGNTTCPTAEFDKCPVLQAVWAKDAELLSSTE